MASKKISINYQWRLFLPLVALLWTMTGFIFYWQFEREKDYRTQQLKQNLGLINSRILHAYQFGADLPSYMDFILYYYDKNEMFDDLRVSLYDASTGECTFQLGELIPYNPDDRYGAEVSTTQIKIDPESVGYLGDEEFFYAVNHTVDGRNVVYTAMAFGDEVSDEIFRDVGMWSVIFIIAIIFTIVAFVLSHYVGRSVKLLRDFATRAAKDSSFVPDSEFPHDELGEISHQIISLYHERAEANERMRQEHRNAIHQMEEKTRVRRELTNNINHELKTPVGIVKGYLDTIVQDPNMPASVRNSFLQKALDNTNRLAKLLSELSTITRLDDGGGNVIVTDKVDFHDVACTVVNEVEESGVLNGMKVVYNVPYNCFVNANEEMLRSLLNNLIKNAVAYSKGKQITIEMDSEDDKFFHFSFYDDGVGVDDEHLPHLFERFYRVEKGRSRNVSGGTGLGLAIVYLVVKTHGGTINIRNQEPHGLRFDFSLLKWTPPKKDPEENPDTTEENESVENTEAEDNGANSQADTNEKTPVTDSLN